MSNRVDMVADVLLGPRAVKQADGDPGDSLLERIADYLECETAESEENCRGYASDILKMVRGEA